MTSYDTMASSVPAPKTRIAFWNQHPWSLTQAGDPGKRVDGRWWWLGVHGGAGVSTLARLIPDGADAHRLWPSPRFGGPLTVVLVCRTHVQGLERARWAAQQWASHDVPEGLRLAGVVAVSDAPGRLHRPQLESLRLLEGVCPAVWVIPWIAELRLTSDPTQLGPAPPSVVQLDDALHAITQPAKH